MARLSKWLREDDPLYPCTTVAERRKLYCYLMVTSRILDVVGGDWQKTVDWCNKAEPAWVATCFQSLGRDASAARSRTRPDRSHLLAGREMEGQCIYGAARDITSMDAGARRSSKFCYAVTARCRPDASTGSARSSAASRRVGARRAACRSAAPKQYWTSASRARAPRRVGRDGARRRARWRL